MPGRQNAEGGRRRAATLSRIRAEEIGPNLDNPRGLLDERGIARLKRSVEKYGILVPLTVYEDRGRPRRYTILDGEKRLWCARRAGIAEVPANVVDEPGRVQNILLMFRAHGARGDWEIANTALALGDLMDLLPGGRGTPDGELACMTGLRAREIAACRRILNLDKKYIDMATDPDLGARIDGDFFALLTGALEELGGLPGVSSRYKKSHIMDAMVSEYRRGRAMDAPSGELGALRKILSCLRKGADRGVVEASFLEYMEASAGWSPGGPAAAGKGAPRLRVSGAGRRDPAGGGPAERGGRAAAPLTVLAEKIGAAAGAG